MLIIGATDITKSDYKSRSYQYSIYTKRETAIVKTCVVGFVTAWYFDG
jgi:hypothetical protein